MNKLLSYIALPLWVLMLPACNKAIYDDPNAMECPSTGEPMVQIVAEISNYSITDTGLRSSDGTVTEEQYTPFTPNTIKDLAIEKRVDYVMLYVYQGIKHVRTIFYYDTSIISDMPTPFEGLEVKTFGREGDKLSFDLELPAGDYNFLMLVNDLPSLQQAKAGKIRDPKQVVTDYPNGLLARKDLGGTRTDTTEPILMPMVGQQRITVPRATDTRQTLSPAISLERVMARIGLFLTTANEAKTDYLKPRMARVTTDGRTTGRRTTDPLVDFVDQSHRTATYMALPLEGEYTASTGKQLAPTWIKYTQVPAWQSDITTYRTTMTTPKALPLDVDHSYLGAKNNLTGGYHIAKLYQHIPEVAPSGEPNFIYTLPMTVVNAEEKDMPYLLLGINRSGRADTTGDEMLYYRVPIYTLLDAQGTKEYTLRRNTYYRINARLLGESLELILDDGIKVLPMRLVEQTLEVDPDDPNQHNPNPEP